MKKILQKGFLIVSIVLCVYSGISLWKICNEYHEAEKEYEALEELAVAEVTETPKPKRNKTEQEKETTKYQEEKDKPPLQIEFDELWKINKEVVGWIYIGSLQVSYPVVRGTDNDYYLHHSVEGKENSSGAIFMDYENSKDFSDCNTIIYGHNMKSGKMFGTLKNLLSKEVYEKDSCIWIITPEGAWRYQIFSAYTTPEDSDTYTLFSQPDQEYAMYLQAMWERSDYDTGILPEGGESILTLSTCSYSAKYRTVIQALKLEG